MNDLIELYNTKIVEFNKQISIQKSKANLVFYSRLILFIAAAITFFYLIEKHPNLSITIILLTVILFLILLNIQLKIAREITFLQNLIKVNEIEIDLLNNNYEKLNEGAEFIDKQHNFIADLDIFGKRSIFQILNRTSTYTGRIKLAGWLSNPFLNINEITERQSAVKELSKKQEWSQHFVALGFGNTEGKPDKDVIKEWLEEPAIFSSVIFKIIGLVLPALTIATGLLYFIDVLPAGYFLLPFLLQLIIIGFYTKKISQTHDRLSRRFNSINKYVSLIAHVESEKFESKNLIELSSGFANGPEQASVSIGKLKKSVDMLDARMNIVVAMLLNGIFLWDINVMKSIESWKKDHKEKFLKWINNIGEFDAYISLGLYAANNPTFSFPEVVTEPFVIDTENIGHPLLNKNKLVKNNYHIEGSPKIDLLTGANMAGKSTFLRTIGVNLTLAMIGAPVCATKFKFTPVLLFTSLRTNDSLQENESFFYAELKRLQLLIHHYESGKKVFFLLDEILKGTNSKDQHTGSEELIKKIIKLNGVGIVATHDVELSVLANQFPDNVRNLCFEITISDDKLNFDYKIKDGVCRTMNASFLMKKMGIIDQSISHIALAEKGETYS